MRKVRITAMHLVNLHGTKKSKELMVKGLHPDSYLFQTHLHLYRNGRAGNSHDLKAYKRLIPITTIPIIIRISTISVIGISII